MIVIDDIEFNEEPFFEDEINKLVTLKNNNVKIMKLFEVIKKSGGFPNAVR